MTPARRRPSSDPATLASRYAAIAAAACRAIERAPKAPALADLARASGLSPHHFHRVFRAVTGLTPRAYAEAHRRARTRAALDAAGRVTDAVYDAGFASSGRFYAHADAALGMTPRAFRDRGLDERIEYGVARCALGHVLVARTQRGICAVMLGDSRQQLTEALGDRFRNATVVAAPSDFESTLGAVVALIEDPAQRVDLPLDLHGTIFQQRVWRALRDIKPGTTVTYGELAARIGAPKSVRAVARACGANPTAVVVPCHRVVGRDGSLTGYRWGIARKRQLLEKERDRTR